nr:MAG TPA: tail tube protein [Bacteriophage sp.]
MAAAGISTLGITFGYGVETTAGTKPTSFKQLTRINALGGINIEPEQIDASALEDAITRYVKGRADTGGSFAVTVNFTSDTVKEWQDLITAYKALSGGKRMWFETIIPGITNSFFVVAQPPEEIPQPEIGQNELLTLEMNLTIEEYKGLDETVAFTPGE